MSDILIFALGLVLGALAVWQWGISRTRSTLVGQVTEVKRRGVRAIERFKDEVSQQLVQKEHELSETRSKLEDERQAASTTLARLQAESQYLKKQKEQLEKAKVELTSSVEELTSELSTTSHQSFLEFTQFQEIGSSLEKAVEAYTRAVNGMESRLHEAARRLKELGGTPGEETSSLEWLDRLPPVSSEAAEEQGEVEASRKASHPRT